MNMVPLGDVATLVMGQSPKSDTYNKIGDGLPLIAGAGDFGERTPAPSKFTTKSAKVSQPDDILLCIRATIGDLNWSDKEYCLGRGVAALRPIDDDALFKNYLWMALKYSADLIAKKGKGAVFKSVSRDDIKSVEIPLPSFDEQKRIAAILDQADELRRLRQQAIAKLNGLGQSIFHEMFDSDLQELPVSPLKEHTCEFRYGTSNKSSLNGHPALRIPNVIGGDVDLSKIKYIPVSSSELDKLRLHNGDMLFVRTNGNSAYVGRSMIFDSASVSQSGIKTNDWIFASYLIRARLKKSLNPVFLQYFLTSQKGCSLLRERCKTAAGQYNINVQGLESIPVPSISSERQLEFAKKVKEVKKQKLALRKSAVIMDTLFAALQKQAFRGEL